MAYVPGNFDIAHVLIQWGGKLPGNEEWSCSIRCAQTVHPIGSATVPDQPAVASWLNGAIKDAVQAYHVNPDTNIHPNAKLSFVKANRINIDGHYTDQLTNEHVFADVAGGGGGYSPYPNQTTVAVSLTTGFSRGPAHRGRFYLPLPAVSLTAQGVMTVGIPAQIASSTKTFIEALADVPGLDTPERLKPCVMSRKAGAPAHREITGVEVGAVVDTQRRRRGKLLENYLRVTLDTGAA